jgi:fluoroacetyl-CoA thioesterase
METNHPLTTGIKGTQEITTGPKDTAMAHGSGTVAVFATPALIAIMEKAAHVSVQQFLPPGHITVGTEISIRHIKATGLGRKVTAQSVVTAVEGKKLTFELEAWDEEGKIGFGKHTRYMVEEKSFMQAVDL